MESEQLRKFLERNIKIDKALGINQQEHLIGLLNQLTKLEHLAEIGEATMKAFEKHGEFNIDTGKNEFHAFYSVDQLVEYFKEDK